MHSVCADCMCTFSVLAESGRGSDGWHVVRLTLSIVCVCIAPLDVLCAHLACVLIIIMRMRRARAHLPNKRQQHRRKETTTRKQWNALKTIPNFVFARRFFSICVGVADAVSFSPPLHRKKSERNNASSRRFSGCAFACTLLWSLWHNRIFDFRTGFDYTIEAHACLHTHTHTLTRTSHMPPPRANL